MSAPAAPAPAPAPAPHPWLNVSKGEEFNAIISQDEPDVIFLVETKLDDIYPCYMSAKYG